MNVEQIAEKFKIPLRHVKRLAKAGLLDLTKEDERIPKIKNSLRCGGRLSVWHCLTLIREPALIHKLGPQQVKAEAVLADIGKVREGLGEQSYNLIFGTAILDPDFTNRLASLVREKFPPGLSYHALAVRLLWDVPPGQIRGAANYVQKAIANLKNHKELQTWFEPLDL